MRKEAAKDLRFSEKEKSHRRRWIEHAAHVGKMRNAYKILV
jgi:hypothetical protein